MEKLDLLEEPFIDNSIACENYIDFVPNSTGILNDQTQIYIETNNKNSIVQLDESYFIIDIDLTKSDGTRFADRDKIGVINNSVMYLFNEAKLYFDEVEIEKISNLGRNTLCNGYLSYDSKYGSGEGHLHGWYHCTTTSYDNLGYKNMIQEILNASTTKKGRFRFNVPFNHIFGYKGKALMGMICRVEFVRVLGNDCIYRERPAAATGSTTTTDTNEAKIVIERMSWSVPTYELNDEARSKLYDIMLKEPIIKLPINTRSLFNTDVPDSTEFVWNVGNLSSRERVYGLILFFQTARMNTDQFTSPAMFDHCNLQSARLSFNDKDYPGIFLKNTFDELGYLDWYKLFNCFRKNVLCIAEDSGITPQTFKNVCPFYTFDLSKQKENIAASNYALKLECSFASSPAAQTRAYALVLTNRVLQFQVFKDRTMKYISNF